MSDEEKESSGLGALLALGAAAAAVATAIKVFEKEEVEDISLSESTIKVNEEVSILIPAHLDDAADTIKSANSQINLFDYDVLTLEDKGHESDKPEAWSSKSWACQRIAFKATGDYLVFIENGIKLTPDAVSIAINTMKENQLDACLIQPAILNKTEPTVIANFLLTLPTLLNLNEGTEVDAGFLIINRNAYSALAGHTRVANEKFEGGAWVKELTAAEFKVAVVKGSSIASKIATIEIPEIDEDLAIRAGTFLGTYLVPVLAIASGRGFFKQLFGSIGLIANIASVIKSKRIR